jgi:hypothetical protein
VFGHVLMIVDDRYQFDACATMLGARNVRVNIMFA